VTPAARRSLPALALALSLGAGCKAQVPVITEPFSDDFDRAEVGATWNNTGAEYRIADGRLNVSNARNHPLWLRRRLPRDVVVDVDVMSRSPEGDLKIELYGDGVSFDPDGNRYDPSGYIFVFGGWQNSLSIIGRLGEHEDAVKVSRPKPQVEPGRTYHWTIARKGGQLEWKIDGQPFLSWTDKEPLGGEHHEYLGVNDWQTDIYFDNLRIRPAP
jgi:hypothetical protein